MRIWAAFASLLLLLTAGATAAPAQALSPYEQEVLATINRARADPPAYADTLRQYRKYYVGNIVRIPGQVDYETDEGVAAVDEAITFLMKQPPLPPLKPFEVDRLFTETAIDHTTEQNATGATGHFSADGASPSDRVMKHGGGPYVGEVIAYGPTDPVDAVRQLIIDDGVPDRGHRTLLFKADIRYAGVSCGPHPEFKTMCVIDMADTDDGWAPGHHPRVASTGSANTP